MRVPAVTVMRRVTTLISLSSIAHRTSGFSSHCFINSKIFVPQHRLQKSVIMGLSSSNDASQAATIIDKQELSQIIKNAENGVTEYVIFDVRGAGEVASTGSLSSSVLNLPIETIAVSFC